MVSEQPAPGPASPSEEPEPEPRALTGKMDRMARPAFQGPPPKTPTWIDAFRMQVAARSPRLARCFEGAERPGQLKWRVAVEPVSGQVSDSELEPMLLSDDLTRIERDCVMSVLSDPPYALKGDEEDPTLPTRVGLVIEF